MLDPRIALEYYSRPEIREAIVEHAKDKEAVGSINNEVFRKRPDVLQYPADVYELAKQGVTSFHASEERWSNPLFLQPGMQRKVINELRIGWDLVLDIDCPDLDLSRLAAVLLIQAIRYHDVKAVTIKFSGNHGFHLGIPFEAFPEKIGDKETCLIFPEAPRIIAAYLKDFIASHLRKDMLQRYSLQELAVRGKKKEEDIVKNGEFDPYAVLSLDTVLISSRHLYRMPYSFNEKSNLISVPILPEEVMTFSKEDAQPDKVFPKAFPHMKFLDREVIPFEARRFVQEAYDHRTPSEEIYTIEKKTQRVEPQDAVSEQFFPPCVHNILKGLPDGKKRSLFILLNFLRCCHWPNENVEDLINEWNKRNPEPVRDIFLLGQLRYFKQKKEKIPPPNCTNIQQNHHDIGICTPDNFCRKIKNPVQYAKWRARSARRETEKETAKPREKLTEEQKEMRRRYRLSVIDMPPVSPTTNVNYSE